MKKIVIIPNNKPVVTGSIIKVNNTLTICEENNNEPTSDEVNVNIYIVDLDAKTNTPGFYYDINLHKITTDISKLYIHKVIATSNPSLPIPQLSTQAIKTIVEHNDIIDNFTLIYNIGYVNQDGIMTIDFTFNDYSDIKLNELDPKMQIWVSIIHKNSNNDVLYHTISGNPEWKGKSIINYIVSVQHKDLKQLYDDITAYDANKWFINEGYGDGITKEQSERLKPFLNNDDDTMPFDKWFEIYGTSYDTVAIGYHNILDEVRKRQETRRSKLTPVQNILLNKDVLNAANNFAKEYCKTIKAHLIYTNGFSEGVNTICNALIKQGITITKEYLHDLLNILQEEGVSINTENTDKIHSPYCSNCTYFNTDCSKRQKEYNATNLNECYKAKDNNN